MIVAKLGKGISGRDAVAVAAAVAVAVAVGDGLATPLLGLRLGPAAGAATHAVRRTPQAIAAIRIPDISPAHRSRGQPLENG